MSKYIDELIALAESWPAKLSVSSISLLISDSLGGGEWMLNTIQYLTFADLVLGAFSAIRAKQFEAEQFIKGVHKITSLYLALIIVGIGTHAIDNIAGGVTIFGISGTMLYDLFIFYLITCELVSINNHCANFGLPINKKLTEYLAAFNGKIEQKLKGLLSHDK